MPMTVGDAFLTFRGDLTQLNTAFAEVQQGATTALAPAQAQVDALGAGLDRVATEAETTAAALTETAGAAKAAAESGTAAGAQIETAWQKVAKATVENYLAQKELSAALYVVKSTGGESAEAVNRLALAQERAARATTQLTEARTLATASSEQLAVAETLTAESTTLAAGAMEKETFSMYEAKGAMALVGEEVGVNIPRHVRGFIATLPGVGQALNAAFSAIAIVVVIQLIVEATEKLYAFIESFHQLSEEEKKAFDQYAKDLQDATERTKKIVELEHERQLIGKTELEQSQLRAQWSKNEAEGLDGLYQRELKRYEAAKKTKELFENQGAQSTGFEQSDVDIAGAVQTVSNDEMRQAEATIRTLEALYGEGLKKLQDQVSVATTKVSTVTAEQLQKQLEERIKNGEAQVNVEKVKDDALLALSEAQATLWLAQTKNSYFEQGRLQALFAEDRYALEHQTLERLRDLAALDPKNANKVAELNAKIEALEAQHDARLLNQAADFFKKIAELRAESVKAQEVGVTGGIEQSPEGKAIQALQDALKALGVQGSATWSQMAIDAEEAWKKIRDGGGTTTDILQARLKMLQAQLGEALSFGDQNTAAKLRSDIESITKELERLGIIVDRTGQKFGVGFAHQMDVWARNLQKNRGELSKTQQEFNGVLLDATNAMGSAVESWIMGNASLGEALRQGLAAEAANIAGRAIMWGLYFTAWGIADLFWNPARAPADFAAAGEFFAVAAIAGGFAAAIRPGKQGGGSENSFNSGTGAPVETTPVSSGNIEPTQNIQHFATGALVTRPTLAVLGDSVLSASGMGREAALPLDDPRAMSQIADAIASRMPMQRGAGGDIHITLEGDMANLVRKINHTVKNNGVQLTASNALRVTKKA